MVSGLECKSNKYLQEIGKKFIEINSIQELPKLKQQFGAIESRCRKDYNNGLMKPSEFHSLNSIFLKMKKI